MPSVFDTSKCSMSSIGALPSDTIKLIDDCKVTEVPPAIYDIPDLSFETPVFPSGVEGPQGRTGVDGSAWHSGAGLPPSELGSWGDYYLNTGIDGLGKGDVYRKTKDGWTYVTTLSGGGGGGPENCPRVSNVTCTANMLVVTYQLACETTEMPELSGNCPIGAPVGSILMWTQETLPTGWLECDGGAFDPVEYPDLFDLYGNNQLPDLRAAFVRGRGGVADALNPFGANYPYKTGVPINPFFVPAGGAVGGGVAVVASAVVTGGVAVTGGDSETVPTHKVLIYMVKAAT